MLRRTPGVSNSNTWFVEFAGEQRPVSRSHLQRDPSGRLACDICREHLQRKFAVIGEIQCAIGVRDLATAAANKVVKCSVQLNQPYHVKSQAEAMIQASSSVSAQTLPSHDASCSLFLPPRPVEDHEALNQRPQSGANSSADRIFEGCNTLANLTEDIPDFWGATLDLGFTLDVLPLLPNNTFPLSNPLGSVYTPTSSLVPPNFSPLRYATAQETVEAISLQDLAALYCAHSSTYRAIPLTDSRRHHSYFDVFYPVLPIPSKPRFYQELTQNPNSPRTRGLSYGVALIAAKISLKYAHLQQACYSNARNVIQTLLSIIRYELTKQYFGRAWMTLGRAITLAQILDLYHLDSGSFAPHKISDQSVSSTEIEFPDLRDQASLEEMRRSFWSLYIFESYPNVRIGRPSRIKEDKLHIFLPSPRELDEIFAPS
ncbi:hypothetical protein BBP40_009548 [Aspergillus hancockii]|nr:hypothetical protein BBP40_009548 [Aspergillus hancockii]